VSTIDTLETEIEAIKPASRYSLMMMNWWRVHPYW